MQIVIKRLDGERSKLEVDEKEPVIALKRVLAEKMGVDVLQLRLIFKGVHLRDDQSLQDQRVASNDMLHIVLMLQG